MTPPPPLPPKIKFSIEKANIVETPSVVEENYTPSIQGGSVQGGSSESIYSTDLNSYSIEDVYMEDGYILPVNYRDDFNYGMGHPKQSSSYDYLTDQSNSDNESVEDLSNRKVSKVHSPYNRLIATKSTDSITPVIRHHTATADNRQQSIKPVDNGFGRRGVSNRPDRLSQSTPSLNSSVSARQEENDTPVREDRVPQLPSVRELKSKFTVNASPEPAPRKSLSKKKMNLSKPGGMNYQVHSLTARSVPNRMRETLKTGWGTQRDSIVRIQTSNPQAPVEKVAGSYINCDGVEKTKITVGSGPALVGKVKQVSMLYNDNRGDSPEHTGIPAHPAQLPPARRSVYPARQDGYTSDESASGKTAGYGTAGYTSDRSGGNVNSFNNGKYSRKIKHKVSNC